MATLGKRLRDALEAVGVNVWEDASDRVLLRGSGHDREVLLSPAQAEDLLKHLTGTKGSLDSNTAWNYIGNQGWVGEHFPPSSKAKPSLYY